MILMLGRRKVTFLRCCFFLLPLLLRWLVVGVEVMDLGVGDAVPSRGGNGGASFLGKLGPRV